MALRTLLARSTLRTGSSRRSKGTGRRHRYPLPYPRRVRCHHRRGTAKERVQHVKIFIGGQSERPSLETIFVEEEVDAVIDGLLRAAPEMTPTEFAALACFSIGSTTEFVFF